MSASKQVIPSSEPSSLDRLTSLNPTSADLRYRAAFWRKYAIEDCRTADQYDRIVANCAEMEALAARMDAPAPVVQLVTAAKASPVRKLASGVKRGTVSAVAKKPARVGAAEFWSLHARAVSCMVDCFGPRWKLVAPAETVEVRLPAAMCSYVGPLGNKINWRRDQRIPAAQYWPGEALPAGVDVVDPGPRYCGPMGDDHPSVVMIAEARRDQITVDRQWREDNAAALTTARLEQERIEAEDAARVRCQLGRDHVVTHWQRQHENQIFEVRSIRKGYGKPSDHPRGGRVHRFLARAAEMRRTMAAELAQWRAARSAEVVTLRPRVMA